MKLPSHLYAMVDPLGGHHPVALAETLLRAGARVLQLRLKNASGRDFMTAAEQIAARCRQWQAMLIVNDRADVAQLCGAAGVHLGQTDLPLAVARRLLGPEFIIGISTHEVAQARAAEAGGADYIGFGPMFAGGAKQTALGRGLDQLRAVRAAVSLPIVAIGGITEQLVPEVLAAGADAAAIISDIVMAPDIEGKVRRILALRPS